MVVKGMVELSSMPKDFFTNFRSIYHSIHAYLTQAVPLLVSLYCIPSVIEKH